MEYTYYVVTDGTDFLYHQGGVYHRIKGFELKCLFKDKTSFDRKNKLFNDVRDKERNWIVVPVRIAIEWDN